MVSHPGKSSAQGHCLSLFYSLFCACNFNKYWLRHHFKCLINVSGIFGCFWASAIIDTHLSYLLLFKWNWLAVMKSSSCSLEWFTNPLLNLFVHFKGSGYCLWRCKCIWSFSLFDDNTRSSYIHILHDFIHWYMFLMFSSILQSHFNGLLNSQKDYMLCILTSLITLYL